jgi:hypothetical protein
LPVAIALDSASKTITQGILPNESKDLSISDKIWVAHTLNDFANGFDTGAPPVEDAQNDDPLVT